MPFDPGIQFLGIYPTDTLACMPNDDCPRLFTAALFSAAKDGKQPKCPSEEASEISYVSLLTMEYAAVKENMENLYEWVWRDCQDRVLSEKKQGRNSVM